MAESGWPISWAKMEESWLTTPSLDMARSLSSVSIALLSISRWRT